VPAGGLRCCFAFSGASGKFFGRFEASKQSQGARLGAHDYGAIVAQRPNEALAGLDLERFADFLRHSGLPFICQCRYCHQVILPHRLAFLEGE
jgi:hypothetical protein